MIDGSPGLEVGYGATRVIEMEIKSVVFTFISLSWSEYVY